MRLKLLYFDRDRKGFFRLTAPQAGHRRGTSIIEPGRNPNIGLSRTLAISGVEAEPAKARNPPLQALAAGV